MQLLLLDCFNNVTSFACSFFALSSVICGGLSSVLEISPDYERLLTSFENIGYGLYLYEYKKIFSGDCKVFLGFINYKEDKYNKITELMSELFKNSSNVGNIKGANPEVFTYQFEKPDINGLFALKLTFYEGTKVFIGFRPDGMLFPNNLAMELINDGLNVFVNSGNGNMIEFN